MPDFFIKVDTQLRRRGKFHDLCDQLNCDRPTGIGLIVSLWSWAADITQDGIVKVTRRTAEEEIGWAGDVQLLIQALCDNRWLDDLGDGRFRVHGWNEHQGALIEARERQRLKSERFRLKARLQNESLENEVQGLRASAIDDSREMLDMTQDAPKPKRERKPKAEKHSYGSYGKVRLTDEEHGKLLAKHGPEKTTRIIDKLDSYKEARGVVYRSDHAAILNWVEKAVAEDDAKRNGGSSHASRSFIDHMAQFIGGPDE